MPFVHSSCTVPAFGDCASGDLIPFVQSVSDEICLTPRFTPFRIKRNPESSAKGAVRKYKEGEWKENRSQCNRM